MHAECFSLRQPVDRTAGVDRHRLAEERSLAYHRVIAGRLQTEPALLAAAKARVRDWLARESPAPFYATEWASVLEATHEDVAAFLCDEGERARELRQSTPFAGALGARERWHIWREVGERHSSES